MAIVMTYHDLCMVKDRELPQARLRSTMQVLAHHAKCC
jgi:hypothetical protein